MNPQEPRSLALKAASRYGPGCERHKGDPHNLCEACWALEPERDGKAAESLGLPFGTPYTETEAILAAQRLNELSGNEYDEAEADFIEWLGEQFLPNELASLSGAAHTLRICAREARVK